MQNSNLSDFKSLCILRHAILVPQSSEGEGMYTVFGPTNCPWLRPVRLDHIFYKALGNISTRNGPLENGSAAVDESLFFCERFPVGVLPPGGKWANLYIIATPSNESDLGYSCKIAFRSNSGSVSLLNTTINCSNLNICLYHPNSYLQFSMHGYDLASRFFISREGVNSLPLNPYIQNGPVFNTQDTKDEDADSVKTTAQEPFQEGSESLVSQELSIGPARLMSDNQPFSTAFEENTGSSSSDPSRKKAKNKEYSILDDFKLLEPTGSPGLEKIVMRHVKDCQPLRKEYLGTLDKINDEIIKNGIPSNLSLEKVNEKMNFGVFLKPDAEPIQPDTLIGIYSGAYELISLDQRVNCEYIFQLFSSGDEDEGEGIRLNKKTIKYASYPDTAKIGDLFYSHINGNLEGNFTRFINHASSFANIRPALVKLPSGRPTIAFFTTRRIEPGSQLLYDYGVDYWHEQGIVPSKVKPRTYTLELGGSVVYNSDAPTSTTENRVTVSGELFSIISPKLAVFPKKLLKECEKFEAAIEEGVLPNQFMITQERRRTGIHLSESADRIKEGGFVATLTGTISCRKASRNNQIIMEHSSSEIYFNPSEKNCGLESLPVNDEGNLKMELYHNPKDNSVIAVLFADKNIAPGEILSLKTFPALT